MLTSEIGVRLQLEYERGMPSIGSCNVICRIQLAHGLFSVALAEKTLTRDKAPEQIDETKGLYSLLCLLVKT